MTTSSPLFERIATCAYAIRHRQPPVGGHESSYEEVLTFLPPDEATNRENTNLVKASIEYIKLGLRDPTATKAEAKAKIALYVASLIAEGKDNAGLAKEICDRFRGIVDIDRHAMTDIFTFSLCNDRVRKLLDNTLISKRESIGPAIKREKEVEFVILFFNAMENLVCREHMLTDLGYAASLTPDNMEDARKIVNEHVEHIATKCSPCFKEDVLSTPRKQNNLFPAGDGLPVVSIGREPVTYDNVKIVTTKQMEASMIDKLKKKAMIEKLQESLLAKEEKGEFLELMFAAISHASNKNHPVVTYRGLQIESVKTFFLKEMLDEAQEKETLKAMAASAEVFDLGQELASVKEELGSANEQLSSLQKNHDSLRDKWLVSEKDCKRLNIANEELGNKLLRAERYLTLVETNETDLRIEMEKMATDSGKKNKRPRTSKAQNDEVYHRGFGQHREEEEEEEKVYSGDEDEE